MVNFLMFNENQKAEVRKLFGYDDVQKLEQDLDCFEDWIKKQNHFVVKKFDREFLERYLISSKGSVERAKKRLDKLCTLRNLMPEFLQNFDIEKEFNDFFSCVKISGLPHPTKNHYRVVVCSIIKDCDPQKLSLLTFYRYLFVLIDYMLAHDYNAGCEFIFDTKNFSVGLIPRLNPMVVQKASMLVMEAYGIRLRGIHFVSGSKVFETIVSIIKQGFNDKLSKRVYVHSNYESLYKTFPREILPKDLGGNDLSIQALSDKTFTLISAQSHIEIVKKMEQAVTDETRRLSSKFNEEYSGMPGSFKKLCVD